MMTILLLGLACVLQVAAVDKPVGKGPTRMRSVAMVLTVAGKATFTRGGETRPLHEMELLLREDRLEAPEGGVAIVVLSNGDVARLKPKARVTVGVNGCTPSDAVDKQEARLTKPNLKALQSLTASSRNGVGVLRDPDKGKPPAVRPLFDSTVLTDHPTFAWPERKGATRYEVRLTTGEGKDERLVWKAVTEASPLPYPEGEEVLPPGVFFWGVTAKTPDGHMPVVRRAGFVVEGSAERTKLRPLRARAAGNDPADWLLAAAVFEAAAAYGDALLLYEKLAAKRPQEPNYQRALASYYLKAGLPDRAEAVRKRAEELAKSGDAK